MDKLAISLFSSLNFRHDWKPPFMKEEEYIQTFSMYDEMLIQFYASKNVEFEIDCKNLCSGTSTMLTPELISSNEDTDIYNLRIHRQKKGIYLLTITRTNMRRRKQIAYSYYKITDYEELAENTILVAATHNKNNFDTIFISESEKQFLFRFRVEGGFMPGELSFQTESENFRDQRYSNHLLSAYPYKTKTLTIGNGFGVPAWIGEKMNLLLCCSDIYINGYRHTRTEGAGIDVRELGNRYYPKYVYKAELEETENRFSVEFSAGSTEWLLRNGVWEDGIWILGEKSTWHE